MKTKYSILIILFVFLVSAVYAQETGKKSKQERKLERQKQTEELVNSKTFLFIGSNAYPETGRPITISSGPNTVNFSPEMIKSNLPFFGQVKTASAGFGAQTGYTFEGKPEEYTIESSKKGYKLKAVVRDGNDSYTLNMSIGDDGNANLNVYSINRSSMRYNGEIRKPEETK
jgi:hypothetical protein